MVPVENQIERSSESNEEIFYCRNVKQGIEARGKYRKDGFFIVKKLNLKTGSHAIYGAKNKASRMEEKDA